MITWGIIIMTMSMHTIMGAVISCTITITMAMTMTINKAWMTMIITIITTTTTTTGSFYLTSCTSLKDAGSSRKLPRSMERMVVVGLDLLDLLDLHSP
mmetsp:Transcript_18873/g.40651  ORF Transcript_18873/g.40651 Transcript_18873/m.40651 type:complete len:98 (-) Transcript_18873:193-486(-)